MVHELNTLLEGARLIANQDMTVRAAAQVVGVSKSGLHKFCCSELERENPALYIRTKAKLKEHLDVRHIRGGEATKQKYLLAATHA